MALGLGSDGHASLVLACLGLTCHTSGSASLCWSEVTSLFRQHELHCVSLNSICSLRLVSVDKSLFKPMPKE